MHQHSLPLQPRMSVPVFQSRVLANGIVCAIMAPNLTREYACFCGPAGKVCCGFSIKVWERHWQWHPSGKNANKDKEKEAAEIDKNPKTDKTAERSPDLDWANIAQSESPEAVSATAE